ncbi:PAS domain S-box protein [Natronorubrum tibetense]|uniref:histidine kinase n=1 Tax=Natronorubrum tibetense GA33 TaxID=1114856 RepID=L9W7E4_9EURY|nr:PAS domain S-box protein [Natronorubrum tibetense]ELY45394.1 PAS/PAC sensor signal transduction histidine kinase [Natronorubrum tibetense GA33]
MSTRTGATDGSFWGEVDDDLALTRYRALVETIDDGLYQLDADGRFVAVNDELVAVTGYARDELVGEHVSLLLGDSTIDAIEREIANRLRSDDDAATFELEVQTADGETLPCELRINPIVEDGEFRGTIGVARDRSRPTRTLHATDAERSAPADIADTSSESITTILDDANIGVVVLDDGFDIAWIDETIEDIFGLERESIVGRDNRRVLEDALSELVAEPDSFAETVLATYDEGSYTDGLECRITGTADDDFEERWLEYQSEPIESGEYAGGRVEIYYDISDRKRSEGVLRENQAVFHSLVDAVEEYAIFRLDPEGHITSWNEGATQIKGYDREEILGEHISRFYTDADRDANVPKRNLEAATENGSVEDEGWRVREDGTQFWANVTITRIRDEDGTHQGFLKVTRDMTDRWQFERELETELQRMLSRISDAFYAVDDEFRFTHVNDRAEELLQHSEEELLGEQLWDVFPDLVEIDEVWDAFHTALDTQEPTSYELYYDTLDFWVEANLYPSETGISVYFRDITERKERQQALEESEQRYRTLAEYFPNGLVTLFDHNLEYTLAAGQGFDRIPVDPDYLEGETVYEAWPDGTSDELEPVFLAALEGEERSIEISYADQEWVIHAVPITDERGAVITGMTMAQDITEQKEREQYLEDAKAQLEAATEAGAVGTWEWQIPEDQFVTGRSFAKKFGVDPDAAREGVPLDRIMSSIHEADRDRVERRIEAVLESGGEYEEEYRVWNADGELRWVVARGHVEYDENGTPETFPGALTDITERKRTELELQRNKEQLQSLFEILPVGAIVAEQNGGIVEANRAAKEIWGVDALDADSFDDYDQFPVRRADTGESLERDEWTIARVLQGEEVTEPGTFEIDSRDGEQRILSVRGMPIRDARGDVTRAVITLSDITERTEYQRRLEETIAQLEESNERLEHFAYAASHDLQEPLRMVSSYLRLVEDRYGDQLDEDGEEFLEFAVDGADRMREMIEGLLAYSRVETRGDPLEPTDLDAVFEDVVADLQLQIEESDAEITIDELPRVEGDASQLRQVFQNLLTNAITYSGEEPPRIHIEAERRDRNWVVSVHDEGIGIEAEDQERVFEVFQRLHSRGKHSGTGIGLALCQRIIERHGGDIWLDSEPGEGTTFSFTLSAAERQ